MTLKDFLFGEQAKPTRLAQHLSNTLGWTIDECLREPLKTVEFSNVPDLDIETFEDALGAYFGESVRRLDGGYTWLYTRSKGNVSTQFIATIGYTPQDESVIFTYNIPASPDLLS